jgi:predicted nucleic acid-binding protein
MLLDTSGLLCLHHAQSDLHTLAVERFEHAVRRVTHNYVLAEFVALVHARKIPRRQALCYIVELADNPVVEVFWVTAAMHRAGLDLLKRRPDKSYSLCDAVSFLVMEDLGITDALTTDRHFEQEGYVRLLK